MDATTLLELLQNKISEKAIDVWEMKSQAYFVDQCEKAERAEYDLHIWQEVLDYLIDIVTKEEL